MQIMMVSFTRYFARLQLNLAAWLRLFLLLAGLMGALGTHAAGIKTIKTEADILPPRIELFARFTVSLNPELDEALRNGLTLPFVYEFKLTKPRLYAWYRQVAEGFGPNATATHRLSFQPLTKQYRIAAAGVVRHFNSLDEALTALGTLKNWVVMDGADLQSEDFAGKLRLRLDGSQLPKAFQLSTIGNTNWQLESGWSEIQLRRPAETEPVQ